MASIVAEPPPAAVTERRISWLTLLIGFLAALPVALLRDRLWGAGLAIGAALAWLNFRWLRSGLDSLVVASTAHAGMKNPAVLFLTYFTVAYDFGMLPLT